MPQLIYIGMDGIAPTFEAYILVLDPTTDEVIDSIPYPSEVALLWISASPNGRFMVIHPGAPLTAWSLEARSLLAQLPTRAISVLFLPDERRMFATVFDSTLVYSVPGFQLSGVIPHELLDAELVPGTSTLIGLEFGNKIGGPPFDNKLLVYDYVTGEVVDSLTPMRASGGGDPILDRHQIAPRGKLLYGIIGDREGRWVYGYDLAQRAMMFATPYEGESIGHVRITPDGKEIWLTHGATPLLVPWPEYVTVLDANTGIPLDTIFMGREELDWPNRISPKDICFYPDGRKAYVICGMRFTLEQPVVVIDMDTKEILSVLFGDTTRVPSAIAIAPAQ